jgi:hypothetical protein
MTDAAPPAAAAEPQPTPATPSPAPAPARATKAKAPRGRPSKARGRPNSSDAADARWTVRGVPTSVREMALKAAEGRGMTVGDWLAEAIVTTVRGAERAARPEPQLPAVETAPPDLPSLLQEFESRLERLERQQQRSFLDYFERWFGRRSKAA